MPAFLQELVKGAMLLADWLAGSPSYRRMKPLKYKKSGSYLMDRTVKVGNIFRVFEMFRSLSQSALGLQVSALSKLIIATSSMKGNLASTASMDYGIYLWVCINSIQSSNRCPLYCQYRPIHCIRDYEHAYLYLQLSKIDEQNREYGKWEETCEVLMQKIDHHLLTRGSNLQRGCMHGQVKPPNYPKFVSVPVLLHKIWQLGTTCQMPDGKLR